MVRLCILKDCVNSRQSTKQQEKIHVFPKESDDRILRTSWYNALGLSTAAKTEHQGVCALHFSVSDYELTHRGNLKLKRTAIPGPPASTPSATQNSGLPIKPNHAELEQTVTTLQSKLKLANLKLKAQGQRLKYQKIRIQNLTKQIAVMRCQDKRTPTLKSIPEATQRLGDMFSAGQMKIIQKKRKYVHWTSKDMSMAIALNSLSSKAYSYVRDVYTIPLPSQSTIKRWLRNLELVPGILYPVFEIMAEIGNSDSFSSVAVLAFDEVEIDDSYCYDQSEDRVYGECSKMLSICLRGLFSHWKQIVYYDFEESITKEKILSVIRQAETVGINVVAMVNDMSTFNMRVWKDLGICITKTYFPNPVTGQKVWTFADFPHLLKLLRNHLLDQFFTLEDGTKIEKSVLERILKHDSMDLKICHKLTAKHLNVEKKERQRVRPAFQLFSNSVSKAITYLNVASTKVSDFFKLVNDFSDLMNSGFYQIDPNPCKNPFGVNITEQKKILLTMQQTIEKMTVGLPPRTRKQALKPFQKGISISITSLLGLFEDMKQPPVNAKYILTRRLSQDYLESSFSNFRSIGGTNTKPNAVNSKSRVKRQIVAWNFLPSRNECIERIESDVFHSSGVADKLCSSKPIARTLETNISVENQEALPVMMFTEDECTMFPQSQMSRDTKSFEGGREYLAGFIAKKLGKENPDLMMKASEKCCENSLWIRHLTRGGLTEPSTIWFKTFRMFEEYFMIFHPAKIDKKPLVVKRLVDWIKKDYPEVSETVIRLFARTRTNIRVTSINREIEAAKIRSRNLKRQQFKDKENSYSEVDTQNTATESEIENSVSLVI